MGLVAGEFDNFFFVAGRVDLPIEMRRFFDDCHCYGEKKLLSHVEKWIR
jgi:hypothetical protein